MIKSEGPVKQATKGEALDFTWKYPIMPVVILVLSLILGASFYNRLPVVLAYHFESDGSPDKWLSREVFMLWMLLPQLLLTLLAWGLTWGVTKLSGLFRQMEGVLIQPERILLFMGNMVAMPQVVLCFAMLDIFVYNSFHVHIMPVWVFALIIMGLGGIVIGVIFIRAMRRVLGARG